ncbi:ABC transporter substrate-binding protein [Ruania alba]|nr:ABC transporter substrate-binding protein [Ruania alba]
MRSGARVAATVATLALGLSACGFDGGNSGEDGPSSSDDQSLVISMQFTPTRGFAIETDDANILTQLGCMETLLRYNDQTGELEPQLATAWEKVEPTVWEFTLQEGVIFQNGTALTAQAVADALQHQLEVEAPARAFGPSHIAGIEAVDEQTLQVTTPEESRLLPFRMASVNTGILAPEAYADSGIDPIGTCTGPFAITDYQPSQSLTLERNEDYWGTPAALDSVEALFVPEGATRATQVRGGEADIAMAVPSTSLTDLEATEGLTVTREFTPRTTGLYLNSSREPFSDVRVRQAVQLALDLPAIAATVYNETAQPAIGPFAPNEAWAPEIEPAQQDLDAARDLLAEAGYQEGDLSLTLLGYTERPEFGDLAAVVQANLGEIGIEVEVNIPDYAAIEPDLLSGDYDMTLLSRNHLVDIADPSGFLTADYTCDGGYNISHYCNEEFDAMLAEAGSHEDETERQAAYADVAQFLQEEAVTVFMVHEQTLAAVSDDVTGFRDDPLVRYAITPDVSLN